MAKPENNNEKPKKPKAREYVLLHKHRTADGKKLNKGDRITLTKEQLPAFANKIIDPRDIVGGESNEVLEARLEEVNLANTELKAKVATLEETNSSLTEKNDAQETEINFLKKQLAAKGGGQSTPEGEGTPKPKGNNKQQSPTDNEGGQKPKAEKDGTSNAPNGDGSSTDSTEEEDEDEDL